MYTIPLGTIKKFHLKYYILKECHIIDLCCTKEIHESNHLTISNTYVLQNRINNKIIEFKENNPYLIYDFQSTYIAQVNKLYIYFWRPETDEEFNKRMCSMDINKRDRLISLLNTFLIDNNSSNYVEREKINLFEKEFLASLYEHKENL